MSDTPHPGSIALPRGAARVMIRVGFLPAFLASFVLSLALVWAFVAAAPMAFLSRDYPLWMAKKNLIDQCRPDTVMFFGDSRAVAGIVPAAMEVPSINLALSGATPIETNHEVARVLRCPTAPRLVVIAHSPLKYAGDPDFWTFDAKFGFLPPGDLRAVLSRATALGEGRSFGTDDHLSSLARAVLFSLRFPGFYFDSLLNAGVIGRWWHNRHAERDALASGGQAVFGQANGSNAEATEAAIGAFERSRTIDFYLDETLRMLAQHHVPVVLMTMPVNRATFRASSPAMVDRFDAYRHSTAARFANVTLIGPALPCWPNAMFGDAWHFNAKGSWAFSRTVAGALRGLLAGGKPGDLPDRCR